MNVPGITAQHAIITPTCRKNKGDQAVIEETLHRMRSELEQCLPNWPIDAAMFHAVISVERIE